MRRLDYILAAISLAWVACLLTVPGLPGGQPFFYVTAALIATNLVVSLVQLFRRGRILIVLNLAQLPLFCILNFQLFTAFGEHHYQFANYPAAWDWIELTAVHVLRAVDILDGLEAYGIDLQNIHNQSVVSGVLLVCMHVAVDIFVIALIFRWVSQLLKRRGDLGRQASGRHFLSVSESGALWSRLAAVLRIIGLSGLGLLVLMCMDTHATRPLDWLLWPLDNVLRTLDIGDTFQVFHWQLHDVPMEFWTIALAIGLRFAAGVYLGEWIVRLRLSVWPHGLTVEQLIAGLENPQPSARVAACMKLAEYRTGEKAAILALIRLRTGTGLAVRVAAREALDQIGPAAVPALIELLAHQDEFVRGDSAETLGRIGGSAGPALSALENLLADKDQNVRQAAAEALGKIKAALQM